MKISSCSALHFNTLVTIFDELNLTAANWQITPFTGDEKNRGTFFSCHFNLTRMVADLELANNGPHVHVRPPSFDCILNSAQQSSEKGNGLSPISREALRKPLVKYEERHAGVCADPCISIVTNEISQVSLDDCFAAFMSCPNRIRLRASRTASIVPYFCVCGQSSTCLEVPQNFFRWRGIAGAWAVLIQIQKPQNLKTSTEVPLLRHRRRRKRHPEKRPQVARIRPRRCRKK